jgi:hypothetical protein
VYGIGIIQPEQGMGPLPTVPLNLNGHTAALALIPVYTPQHGKFVLLQGPLMVPNAAIKESQADPNSAWLTDFAKV